MKRSVCFALAALFLGACTRTIVEKPVVERDTVIERPVIATTPAPVAAAPRACTYAGTSYSHGSSSCQSQYEYRCSDGSWSSTNVRC